MHLSVEIDEINMDNSNDYNENDKLWEFLSPVKIGYSKINCNIIKSTNQIEYPIQMDDINIPNCILYWIYSKDKLISLFRHRVFKK